MQTTITNFAGWALCAASIGLLISFGKLDLMIILFPLSLFLGYVISGGSRGKQQAVEPGRKRVA